MAHFCQYDHYASANKRLGQIKFPNTLLIICPVFGGRLILPNFPLHFSLSEISKNYNRFISGKMCILSKIIIYICMSALQFAINDVSTHNFSTSFHSWHNGICFGEKEVSVLATFVLRLCYQAYDDRVRSFFT